MTACSSFPELEEQSFCQLRGSRGTKGGAQESIWDTKRRTKKQGCGGLSCFQKILEKLLEIYNAFSVPQTTENSLSTYAFQNRENLHNGKQQY